MSSIYGPFLGRGNVLYKNLQSYRGGLFCFNFKVRHRSEWQSWKYLGELQAYRQNYIPSMLKPAQFEENFGVMGVVLLFLFHVFHADLDRVYLLNLWTAQSWESPTSMVRSELAYKIIWINWEIVRNKWLKSNRGKSTGYWTEAEISQSINKSQGEDEEGPSSGWGAEQAGADFQKCWRISGFPLSEDDGACRKLGKVLTS